MELFEDRLKGVKSEVHLSDYTTIGLGGVAKYFVACQTIEEIRSALKFAEEENVPVQILGGGSNVIFPDESFNGLVIKVDSRGVEFESGGEYTMVRVGAGEVWDDLVKSCLEKNLGGIECLSGIPGSVGATPIQNVGAYGQEVKDTIVSVKAIDRKSREIVEFLSADCEFGYRKSRFKVRDKDKFVIVEVCFKLKNSGKPSIKYEELQNYLEMRKTEVSSSRPSVGSLSLKDVREAILALRRKKSMVIDPNDPNSRSVGSFFVNPILSEVEYKNFTDRLSLYGFSKAPSYKSTEGVKVPSAWLIESSGFYRGYKKNGVGISPNHALALVNYSGTTKEILSLASEIENAVYERFRIKLQKEAVIVCGS